MPFLEHDKIRFHYELSGEGRLLVFCHGLTGSLENARDAFGVFPGHLQIFWDARGHGATAPFGPLNGYSFDGFAQDLAAILDHLNIRDAVIGGISMGAAVSARFAIRYPARVRGLVLVRPAWLTEPLPEGLRLFPLAAGLMERYGAQRGLELFDQQFPDADATLREQFLLKDAAERRSRLVGIPGDTPIRDWAEVANLQMPALVIGNEPDDVHPLAYAIEWAKRLPHARFVQVPAKSAGFEPYAHAVHHHVAEFLKENP